MLISCYFPTRVHRVTDVRHATFCHVIQQCFRCDNEQIEEMKCVNSVVSISGKLAKCREVEGSTIFRKYWLCTFIILRLIFSPFINFKIVARFSIFTLSILLVCCLHCASFQLPPVIKNMAFQKFSNMEQSLFTRFVRLGVPTVQLDAQGRARSRYIAYVLFGCLSNKCVTEQQIRHLATKTSPSNKCVTVEQIRLLATKTSPWNKYVTERGGRKKRK